MSKHTGSFRIYKSGDEWRWRLVAANGNILASGESYSDRRNAEKAIRAVKKSASYPIITDPPQPAGEEYKFAWRQHIGAPLDSEPARGSTLNQLPGQPLVQSQSV